MIKIPAISKIFLAMMVFCLPLSVFSQKTGDSKPANKQPAIVKLLTSADTTQYAVGAFVAAWMTQNGLSIQNPALFSKGMNDIIFNAPRLLPDSVVLQRVSAFQKAGLKDKAVREGEQLFASLRGRPGIGVLPSGVHYRVLKTGKGSYATENDTLIINLIARLPNGNIVEDTYQSKKPFMTTFPGLFQGLGDPIRIMPEGSQWQLFIPAVLAYGEKGTALIPANSAIIIDVELVEIRHTKQ